MTGNSAAGAEPQEPDPALRPGLSGAGRGDRRGARRRAHRHLGVRLRQRRDLRPVRGLGARQRRLRHPEPHGADQHLGDGDADHGRRAQARVGEADHRGHAVLPVLAAGQEAPRPGADLGPADGRPVRAGRGRPDHVGRPAHRADPGLLRRAGGPPVRAAAAGRLRRGEVRRGQVHRGLAGLRPGAGGRAVDRPARRLPAGVHPQDPRPAQAQRGRRAPGRRRRGRAQLHPRRRHDRHRHARSSTRPGSSRTPAPRT